MTVQQCYEEMGSNYEEVLQRLRSTQLIQKIILKFPSDQSFSSLLTAMEKGDREGAFLAAHTLKGISQNLGFTDLYEASAALTEVLRGETAKGQEKLVDAVKAAYEKTAAAIDRYRSETEQ